MSRLLVLFFLFLNLSYAHEIKPIELKIDKSYSSYGFIKTDQKLNIGSSGLVWQKIADEVSSIVARVVVSKKVDNGYEVAYKVYDDLAQQALPYPSILPKEGDLVILNHLYKRVLPITPSADAHKAMQNKYNSLDFIEPDLFTAYLFKRGISVPNQKDFSDFCKKSGTSLIYFAFNDGGKFVDCHSFYTQEIDRVLYRVQYPQEPFYSRIKDSDPETMNTILGIVKSIEIPLINESEEKEVFRKSSLGNFYQYYKSLIKG